MEIKLDDFTYNYQRQVLVDMDGVLFDYESPNNEIIRNFGVTPIENRKGFYYPEVYRNNPDLHRHIYDENRRPGFFRSFPLIEGAIEGWQRILDAGFLPRVCSSPFDHHPTVITEKKECLEEYFVPRFGSWVVDTAIFDRFKSGYDACALIDDHPDVRGSTFAKWQQIVFTQSYNKQLQTRLRLNGWNDPSLETLLQTCRRLYKF